MSWIGCNLNDKIISPDLNHDVTVTNEGAFYDGVEIRTGVSNILSSSDGYKNLLITNNFLEYWDGTRARLNIRSAYTTIYSPDGTNVIEVNNTGLYYNSIEIAVIDDLHDSDKIVSPDTLKDLTISNVNLLYSDGNYARLYIDDTESRITSPDGQSLLQVKNGDFNFKDGTRDRIEADGIGTTLRSTTGAYISLLSNDFLVSDSFRSRIIVSDAESRLTSPDGTNALIMSDASAYITSDLQVNGKTTITQDGEFLKHTTTVTDSMDGKGYMAWYKTDGTTRTAWFGFGSSGNYDLSLRNEKADHNINIQTTGTGTIVMSNLPTSSAGLPTGGLWKSSGTLKVA